MSQVPLDQQYAKCFGANLTFQSVLKDPESPSDMVLFFAYLTDMSQTFNSSWNVQDAFGRMDPIAGFQHTRRAISLAWHVPAGDIKTAKINMINVASLTKMLYPAYAASGDEKAMQAAEAARQKKAKATPTPAAGSAVASIFEENRLILAGAAHTQVLSKPPLIKIKFSNLIQHNKTDGLLGFVDNFSMNPVLEMGFFNDASGIYPKVYSLSCNFNVLHQHDLGHATNGDWIGKNSFPF